MKIADGIKLLSFFPGRVKLRVDDLRDNCALAEAVEARLAAIPGISHVAVNATAASLLVKFSRRRIAQPDSARALGEALRELFPRLDVSRLEHYLTSS